MLQADNHVQNCMPCEAREKPAAPAKKTIERWSDHHSIVKTLVVLGIVAALLISGAVTSASVRHTSTTMLRLTTPAGRHMAYDACKEGTVVVTSAGTV